MGEVVPFKVPVWKVILRQKGRFWNDVFQVTNQSFRGELLELSKENGETVIIPMSNICWIRLGRDFTAAMSFHKAINEARKKEKKDAV